MPGPRATRRGPTVRWSPGGYGVVGVKHKLQRRRRSAVSWFDKLTYKYVEARFFIETGGVEWRDMLLLLPADCLSYRRLPR